VTTVPLVIYTQGERRVIGHCDAEPTEQGGWEISGVVEEPQFQELFRTNKFDPDWYSVEYLKQQGRKAVAVAFVPPPAFPPQGRAKFWGVIPPRKESNDD
jgi:hypothetical protein